MQAAGLKKSYLMGESELEIIRGIDFGLCRGEMIALVGPSGAGKSTLLHMLGALDKPTAGSVFLDDVDIYNLSDCARAAIRNRKIGFVFQFYHLLPEFTVRENVLLPVLINERNSSRQRKKEVSVEELLAELALGGRMNHYPNQLSGGEQQRVAIARALVNDPEIIFADEPTGNLDRKNGEIIFSLLQELNEKQGCTLVIATHAEELAQRAERVLYLIDGKIVEERKKR